MIKNIQKGMTMGEVVDILNQLIDQYNSTEGVIASALVNGKIDYNAIQNRPSVEGVELVGDVNLPSLGAAGQDDVDEEIKTLDSRVSDNESAIEQLPTSTTIAKIRDKINEIVTRSNKLSAAACGEEEFGVCLMPVQQLDL